MHRSTIWIAAVLAGTALACGGGEEAPQSGAGSQPATAAESAAKSATGAMEKAGEMAGTATGSAAEHAQRAAEEAGKAAGAMAEEMKSGAAGAMEGAREAAAGAAGAAAGLAEQAAGAVKSGATGAESAARQMAAAATGSASGLPGDPKKGEALYLTYCASCHGPRGEGDGPVAAGLNPKPAKHSDGAYMNKLSNEHLFKVVKEGGAAVGKSPLMAPWGGTLSDEQIWDVVAYMRTLANPPYQPES